MGDWAAEDLSKAIERRRGRPRRARGLVRDAPAKPATGWTEAEWASRFVFEYGYSARVRGATQVCIRDDDGAVLWEGGVREIVTLRGGVEREGPDVDHLVEGEVVLAGELSGEVEVGFQKRRAAAFPSRCSSPPRTGSTP